MELICTYIRMYYILTVLVGHCLLHMYCCCMGIKFNQSAPALVYDQYIHTYISVYLNLYPVISLLDPVELDRE